MGKYETSNFKYDHLPANLQEVSKPIGDMALEMDHTLPECDQKNVGMHYLLLAKDAFVRAKLKDV